MSVTKLVDLTPGTYTTAGWTRSGTTWANYPAQGYFTVQATTATGYSQLTAPLPALQRGDRILLLADVAANPGNNAQASLRLQPNAGSGVGNITPAQDHLYVTELSAEDAGMGTTQRLRLAFTTLGTVRFRRIAMYLIPARTPLRDLLTVEAQAPGQGLRLGRDKLATGRLGADATAVVWRELIGQATSIDITRGAQAEGLTSQATAGVATINLLVPADTTPGLGLLPGARVRIRTRVGGTPIFTGRLEPVREQFGPGKERAVTLTVVDAIATLANTTLYGAAGPEPWNARVRRLLGRVSGLDAWRFATRAATRTSPSMARIEAEADAATQLQYATNSAGVRWHVAADGTLVVGTDYLLEGLQPERGWFSDSYAPSSYLDVGVSFDAAASASSLTITNHAAVWDADQGAWQAEDTTHGPYLDPTAMATWGARAAAIETTLQLRQEVDPDTGGYYDRGDVDRLARDYLAERSVPERTITHMVADFTDAPEEAAAYDIAQHLRVLYQDLNQRSAVIGLQHSITPKRWTTTLYLRKVS